MPSFMGPPYLPPGSPAYNAYFANPANRHPPSAYPTFIPPAPQPQIYVGKSSTHPPSIPPPHTPPQPQIYTGKSAPTTPDIDPRPVHQGGMSTYDQPGLANWVAANSFPDHPGPTDRHGPTATTKPHHSTTTAMPKPRSCLKKGVQFTPSVRARDERKQEGRNRTKSNGTRVKRMACKYCHVKARLKGAAVRALDGGMSEESGPGWMAPEGFVRQVVDDDDDGET